MTTYLNQNTSNTVRLTLSESITLTASPIYFLFKLINQSTNVEKIFTATDTSTNIARYNQFNIILTGSSFENLTGGTINLLPDSEHKYEVYEMLSPTNLFISGTSRTIIEKGIFKVSGITTNNIVTSYSGQNTTYNYYTGQNS